MYLVTGILLGILFVTVGWFGPDLQDSLAHAYPTAVDPPSADPLAYARWWQVAGLGFSTLYAPLGLFLHRNHRALAVVMYLFLAPLFLVNLYLTGRPATPPQVSALLSLLPIAAFAIRDSWLGWRRPDDPYSPYGDPEQNEAKRDFLMIDLPALIASVVLAAYIASNAGRQGLDLFYLGAVAFELFVVNGLFIARSLDQPPRRRW